jgi:hypothetical protein
MNDGRISEIVLADFVMNDSSIPVKSSCSMRLRLVVEMKKTSIACLATIVVAVTVAGLVATTPLAPAQSVSGSFNPQIQFPAGSSLQITSIYGIATVPPAIQTTTTIPTQGNHTFRHYNQTQGQRPSNSVHRNFNQTGGQLQPTTYSASITIDAQVSGDADSGLQWTIQGGSVIFNGATYTITSGNGTISSMDRLMMSGNATDPNGNPAKWSLQGLAAMYNDTVIVSLNGGTFSEVSTPTSPREGGVNLTYIATMSTTS